MNSNLEHKRNEKMGLVTTSVKVQIKLFPMNAKKWVGDCSDT